MEFRLSQLGTNLPYFASLNIPDGDYSDKKTKILKVVSLVISVLWNNGVDFDDLGGQKRRGETSEIVPAIHESVSQHLNQIILARLRSKRGTIKRDSGQKNKVRPTSDQRKAKKQKTLSVKSKSSSGDKEDEKGDGHSVSSPGDERDEEDEEEEADEEPTKKGPKTPISQKNLQYQEDSGDELSPNSLKEEKARIEAKNKAARELQARKDKYVVMKVMRGAQQ